jgi:hypothetical protein
MTKTASFAPYGDSPWSGQPAPGPKLSAPKTILGLLALAGLGGGAYGYYKHKKNKETPMTEQELDKQGEIYSAGFTAKCAEYGINPKRLIKLAQAAEAEPYSSRGWDYGSQMVPFGGPIVGAMRAPKGEGLAGAMKGFGGQVAGTLGGGLLGGSGGVLAGALLAKLITKGKGKVPALGHAGYNKGKSVDEALREILTTAGGGYAGGLGGALIGGAEGTRMATRNPNKQK